MKIVITVLALFLVVLGAASLLGLLAIVVAFISGSSPILLFLAVAVLLYSAFAFRTSIHYFIRRDQRAANAVAIMTGFNVWIFVTSPLERLLETIVPPDDVHGDMVVGIGGLVFPVMVALIVTWMLLTRVRLGFEQRIRELDERDNSE